MKSTRFLCLALMIQYTSKTMDVMDYFLVIRIYHKKTVIVITIQKSFFVKQIVLIFSLIMTDFLSSILFYFSVESRHLFWLGILNLKNAKNLKNDK